MCFRVSVLIRIVYLQWYFINGRCDDKQPDIKIKTFFHALLEEAKRKMLSDVGFHISTLQEQPSLNFFKQPLGQYKCQYPGQCNDGHYKNETAA